MCLHMHFVVYCITNLFEYVEVLANTKPTHSSTVRAVVAELKDINYCIWWFRKRLRLWPSKWKALTLHWSACRWAIWASSGSQYIWFCLIAVNIDRDARFVKTILFPLSSFWAILCMYAWDQVVLINRDWERVEAGDWKDLFHVARPRLRTRPVCLFVNHFISRVGNGMECSVLY